MDQSPCWEANSSWATQKFSRDSLPHSQQLTTSPILNQIDPVYDTMPFLEDSP
jgi:hypothetical protein